MPLVIPDNYAEVIFSIRHSSDAEPYAITWGASKGDEGDPQEMVSEIAAATIDNLKVAFGTDFTLGPTTMRLSISGTDTLFYDGTTAAGTGTSNDIAPANCAVLVHKRTALGGRRGRGRLYLPGVLEDAVDAGGLLSTEYLGDLQDAVDAWLAALNDDPLETVGMWLLHSTGETSVPSPSEVTSLQVDPMIATQRRRLRK